jgi:hypothetical protein
MDTAAITGGAAFLAAIIVFVGSAFLLLTLVLGARLAYFVTASVTLCFVLIMAVVWSISSPPLGPAGQSPEWEAEAIGEDATALDFEDASTYPEQPWAEPDDEDANQIIQASELESDATKYAETTLSEGEIEGLPQLATLQISQDSTRLLQKGDTQYGATLVDVLPPPTIPELGIPEDIVAAEEEAAAAPEEEAPEPLGQLAVVMKYDPGDPLGEARMIALGTLVLLVLHLIGLSYSERRVRRQQAEATT